MLFHELAHCRQRGHRRAFVRELALVYRLWLRFRAKERVLAPPTRPSSGGREHREASQVQCQAPGCLIDDSGRSPAADLIRVLKSRLAFLKSQESFSEMLERIIREPQDRARGVDDAS
jgi:hypothetical protein